jgi:putative membrane protein
MKFNYQTVARQICSASLILAGAVFLSVPSALAQMNPSGGAPQQPTSPSPQTTPGSHPGMSPMDQPGMNSNSQDPNGPGAMMDNAFVSKALEGGMAEVQLGKLAVEKSSNEDIKQFGQKMVDDHTKLGDQMKQVAEQMNVKVPDSLSSKDKSTVAKLQALNGDSFDKAYIKDMVKDHKKDEKDFKSAANRATNPALKEAATQGAQVVGEHLQLIQQIAQKNNVAAK